MNHIFEIANVTAAERSSPEEYAKRAYFLPARRFTFVNMGKPWLVKLCEACDLEHDGLVPALRARLMTHYQAENQAAPIIGVPLSAKAVYTEWQAATALVDELAPAGRGQGSRGRAGAGGRGRGRAKTGPKKRSKKKRPKKRACTSHPVDDMINASDDEDSDFDASPGGT